MLYINAFGGNDVLVTSDKVFGKGQLRIMQVDMVDPVSKKMVSTQKEYYIKIKDKKSIALNLDNINGAV